MEFSSWLRYMHLFFPTLCASLPGQGSDKAGPVPMSWPLLAAQRTTLLHIHEHAECSNLSWRTLDSMAAGANPVDIR